LLKNLVKAGTKANNRLAQPCLDVLHFFADQKKYSKQISDYFKSNTANQSKSQFARWY
jgi:hypothetical protein